MISTTTSDYPDFTTSSSLNTVPDLTSKDLFEASTLSHYTSNYHSTTENTSVKETSIVPSQITSTDIENHNTSKISILTTSTAMPIETQTTTTSIPTSILTTTPNPYPRVWYCNFDTSNILSQQCGSVASASSPSISGPTWGLTLGETVTGATPSLVVTDILSISKNN